MVTVADEGISDTRGILDSKSTPKTSSISTTESKVMFMVMGKVKVVLSNESVPLVNV